MLLTTHYMFEADALCDRIAVIAGGEIVAEGTPQRAEGDVADGTVVEVEVFGVEERTVERVRQLPGVRAVGRGPGREQLLIVQSAPGLELTHAIPAQLDGTSVGRVAAREPTLEDAYVALVTGA